MPPESHVPELNVLRRKDASVADDDWPQFDVREVEVRGADGSLTSLFLADPEHPVTITGQLRTKGSSAEGKAAILPSYKSRSRIQIRVENVTYFAFGTFELGGYAIWGAGESGWHTIQPAKSYEKIFEHMIEGLTILYFIIDAYDNGKKTSTGDLFKSYAKENKITLKQATERFYSQATFLASRMAKGEESISWGHTSFYQHLRKTHPEAFAPRSQPVAAPTKSTPAAPPKATATTSRAYAAPKASSSAPRTATSRTQAREISSRSHSADVRPTRAVTMSTAVPAPTKKTTRAFEPAQLQTITRQVGRPRTQSKQSQSQTPLLSELNRAKAKDIWKFIQRKTNETLPEIGEMTIETFARFLFHEYQFPDEKDAQYFLKYLAPDLIGMMSIPRNRSYDPWTELPIYDELIEAKVPPRVKGRIATLKLQKRDKPLPGQEEDTEASDEDSSEESVMDKHEATNRKREAARRRISALRPKSASKYSGKAAKRKGKEKAIAENNEDEEMLDVQADLNNEDVMSVDTPSKRKSMSDDEDGDEDPEYPNKRFTRSQGDLDPELEDLEFSIQQAKSTGLPVRRKPSQSSLPTNNGHTLPMALISEPAPFTDANAPGDIWNCPHSGCIHKVYGASEYESKELIHEHLLDHKDKDRVDLIKNEESMTRLPVNHLLKRIREIAERAGGEQLRALEGGLLGLFPPPLERKVY